MQTIYDLKKIKNSSDRHLTRALSIYSQNIDPLIRTDTREIIYWLDRYNRKFTDKFYIVGLYLNDVIIGYGQFVYFVEEKIVFIDYLAIEKQSRKNNTFYEFTDKIKEFLAEENLHYTYILTEVGYYKENNEPTEVTRNLIRLLKMSGFGVVKMDYFQPMLGKNNYETELSTILMLYTENDVKRIKKETFLLIIDTIYFKHYKRWYDAFFQDKEHALYISRLDDLKKKIELQIKKKEFIEINGYANLFSSRETTVHQKNYVKVAKLVAALIVFALFSMLIGVIVVFVKRRYNLDQDSLQFITYVSLILVIGLSALFYKNKNESFSEVVERVIRLFMK